MTAPARKQVRLADRIYLLSEEGRTVVLQSGTEPKVVATNDLQDNFFASPAIVGNEIFLRGEQHLYCIADSTTSD